ncbi:hypothetical protein B0H15DRAFT_949828 [Mycena belliarum]|uniref:Uncharacterized protein n=1 Tax=Mycena belliarum TaxID=1033014 RepID=A0AAD6XLU5_9AGAR|nr:hypothetical protein B0H15DRAFT_949828 [Mycena belliae]
MGRKQRERVRIPKGDRKNMRLWAEGARETVLQPHIEAYAAALDKGRHSERRFWKGVCKEFHARIDWRTLDAEEPMVAEWDPTAPAAKETLSEEDEAAKRGRIKELNERIRRWFLYRIRRMRKNRVATSLDPTKDPYAVLLSNLSGIRNPPKARQAYQQYMRECYQEKIAPVVAQRWEAARAEGSTSTKDPKAGFRALVAREMFSELSGKEQNGFAARATKEAATSKAAYVKALKDPPSTKPEDRQKCIARISEFMGPILKGLYEYTGLHATLIVGGPMPSFGGELRSLHVSYGRNKTVAGAHWAQWDKPRFKRDVQDFMVEYLKTAYGSEDCAEAALDDTTPATGGGASMLAAATYTISPDRDAVPEGADDESESDSEDDSGDGDSSSSDSDTEGDSAVAVDYSEDEEGDARARKKARMDKALAAAARKQKGKRKEKVKGRRGKMVNDATEAEQLAKERRLAIEKTLLHLRADEDLTYEQRRDRQIARNKLEMAKISAEFRDLFNDNGSKAKASKATSAKRPRAPRQAPGAPTRRSSRLGAVDGVGGNEGEGEPVDEEGEGIGDDEEDDNTGGEGMGDGGAGDDAEDGDYMMPSIVATSAALSATAHDCTTPSRLRTSSPAPSTAAAPAVPRPTPRPRLPALSGVAAPSSPTAPRPSTLSTSSPAPSTAAAPAVPRPTPRPRLPALSRLAAPSTPTAPRPSTLSTSSPAPSTAAAPAVPRPTPRPRLPALLGVAAPSSPTAPRPSTLLTSPPTPSTPPPLGTPPAPAPSMPTTSTAPSPLAPRASPTTSTPPAPTPSTLPTSKPPPPSTAAAAHTTRRVSGGPAVAAQSTLVPCPPKAAAWFIHP